MERVGPHCTADDILADLELHDAGVSRSTVYRALDSLGRAGVVRPVYLGVGPARYERADAEHQHAVCRVCGTVFHLEHGLLREFERHIEEQHHFHPVRTEVLVVGVCDACSHAPQPMTALPRVVEHSH